MAQDKPWLFEVLTSLTSTTQLYTSRKSDTAAVKEYRFTLSTLLNWMKANLGAAAPVRHRFGDQSGTLMVPAGMTTDISKLHVYRDGILIDWDSATNGIERNGTNWDFHIPLDTETIIIHEFS